MDSNREPRATPGNPHQSAPIAGAARQLARIAILGSLLGVLLFAFYVLIAILRAG